MDTDRFQNLLDRYFDEALDDATTEEFEQMLLAYPQARDVFWEQAKLHGMLRQVGLESWGPNALPRPQKKSQRLRRTSWATPTFRTAVSVALVASAAGLMLFFETLDWKRAKTGPNAVDSAPSGLVTAKSATDAEPTSSADRGAASKQPQWVAVLRKEVDVEWEDPSDAMIMGEAISPHRRLSFVAGMVEIKTDRGVAITLEGPADLEILSGMEVVCRKGRLRVDVPPPATGFVVRTPQIDVVDLGTSFAMNVVGQQKSEVHVIEGLVEIGKGQNVGIANRKLREGEAIGVSDGVIKHIAADGDAFPSRQIVTTIHQTTERTRQSAWQRKRALLAKDPNCLVHFDFQDSDESDTLINKAMRAGPQNGGTIIGSQWVQGRWPGKRALEFRDGFDRVLFSVPGKFRQLTCLASVRLDTMGDRPIALLNSLKPNDKDGGFAWNVVPPRNVKDLGFIQFGRQRSGSIDNIGTSFASPYISRSRSGTWIQVAFVWDGKNHLFEQYVNGECVLESQLPRLLGSEDLELQLGDVEIGGPTMFEPQTIFAADNFVGCVDELMVFDRALTEEEVRIHQSELLALWSNRGGDGSWNVPENWCGQFDPSGSAAAIIDRSGKDAAVFSDDSSANLLSLRVGTSPGAKGELRIVGGELRAVKNPSAVSYVGVRGGDGRIVQMGGTSALNSLHIGGRYKSVGVYRLEGGKLQVYRTIAKDLASVEIGDKTGKGRIEIAGGELETRRGVHLGKCGGDGVFSVEGSNPKRIAIGSFGKRDGFWLQESGCKLEVQIDAGGVTPVFIDEVDEEKSDDLRNDGNVIFAKDSLLSVTFANSPRSGYWDVMRWEGVLIDEGLRFADDVDQQIWSFQYVDTDDSGTPDTLRVIANTDKM